MLRIIVSLVLLTFIAASPTRYLDGRIVGGKDIPIELAPYQVSLFVDDRFLCGGSIISKNYVLTAKHCIANRDVKNYFIHSGSAEIHNNNTKIHQTVRFIEYKTTRIIEKKIPDIALIEVTPHFEFNKKQAAVPLFNSREEILPGSIAFVTGWGRTIENLRKTPKLLQGVFIPMITKQKCDMAYKSLGGISKGEICAAHANGGKDACQGDSGGPLTINGRLAGIVSWGIGCARKNFPGVYVEVAHYTEWINEIIQM